MALLSADIGDLIIEELKAQIQNISTRLDELDVDDIAYQMKYDDLVFDQDKKYTDLARVKEEIREVDRRLRQEIIISNSAADEYRALSEYLWNWRSMSELEQKKFFRRYIERVELFEDFDRKERAVKKIVFKFPLRVATSDYTKGDLVPHKNAKLIEKDGEMIYDRWEYVGDSVMANEIRWDKEGHVETVVLMSRVDKYACNKISK